MKIYYVHSDYIEEAYNETENDYSSNEDVYKKLVREGKADIYSPLTFQTAFNNGGISDEGVIFITNN